MQFFKFLLCLRLPQIVQFLHYTTNFLNLNIITSKFSSEWFNVDILTSIRTEEVGPIFVSSECRNQLPN